MSDPVNQPIEEWRSIASFEGLYEVSSLGKVRNARTNKLRALGNWGGHYLTINLYRQGSSKIVAVHRLVAETFLLPPSDCRYVVNHINGQKRDNRVDNLEWCSPAANNLHAYEIGLQRRGVKPSSSTKSLQQRSRTALRRLSAAGIDHALLAEAFNISRSAADAIARHG